MRIYLWNHRFFKIPPKKFNRYLSWKFTHLSIVSLRIITTNHMYVVYKTFQGRNLSNFSVVFWNIVDFTNTFWHYLTFKVHLFWKGLKILQNLHRRSDYYYIRTSTVEILQTFLAFSEYMNFTGLEYTKWSFFKMS